MLSLDSGSGLVIGIVLGLSFLVLVLVFAFCIIKMVRD